MLSLVALAYLFSLIILLANLRDLRHAREHRPSSPSDTGLLSILIPARNEENNLRRLLPGLLEQTYPNYEVIVYDDASEDGTWAVLSSFSSHPRLKALRGTGPPAGWAGKVHALYQAVQAAKGEHFLFLDADALLTHRHALSRLKAAYEGLPRDAVFTGLTRLRGGGLLLVSLVPFAILAALPWPLARRLRHPALGALNGQCWMIDAATYHHLAPHKKVRGAVLEDVEIGRYLLARGIVPTLVDVQDEVQVFMYANLKEAWRGFRKNAYLLMGGTPLRFLLVFLLFTGLFLVAPLLSPWLFLPIYVLKRLTDRYAGFPLWVSLLAPASFVLGALLQIDSWWSHLTGRTTWKGRPV